MQHTMVGLVILNGAMALTRSLAMLMSLTATAYVYKHAAGHIEVEVFD
tara:strand:+ start:9055 stop:9198 length:144 start_codon:yes stop_codon:yes gene_type:complete